MAFDLNQLRKTCVYEGRGPIETMACDLAEIESKASQWHSIRKRLLLSGIGSIVASLVALAIYPPVGVLLIAIGIGLFFYMKHYPKGVANGVFRCEFAKGIAGVLARDADPKSPSSMRLDFNPKRELLSEAALPHRKNGKQQLFRAPWFTLEARLLDGTKFGEDVDDLIRQRSFRNARGKSKTKTRTRQLVAMRLAYPEDTYGDMRPFAARMQKELQLPATALVRGVEVNERAVKLKAVMTESGDLTKASASLALGVYRMMNLSRRIRERRHRRAQSKGGSR